MPDQARLDPCRGTFEPDQETGALFQETSECVPENEELFVERMDFVQGRLEHVQETRETDQAKSAIECGLLTMLERVLHVPLLDQLVPVRGHHLPPVLHVDEVHDLEKLGEVAGLVLPESS